MSKIMKKKVGQRGKQKKGNIRKCPHCGYKWRTTQINKPYICCSRCKRYFKA